ncbi:hypothetical protein [Kitasatospora sp. NRRL B-11411]|uniref:hypothetical protein n=1 Tax=Kitasatospora sp. NRRL B-11411 TaxID=1463822 RepID=UPI000AEA9DF9|nr:hypothetical protein [Kitasatospora sp. NRRL B-11411]
MSPSPSATPSPTLTGPPADDSPAAAATPHPTATKPRAAKTTPRTEVSPKPALPGEEGTYARRPGCFYDPQGRLMTCDPVLTATPLPNPAVPGIPYASPSRQTP